MSEKSQVIIISRSSSKAIAFGSIKKINHTVSPQEALISIDEIIDNSIIMEKDIIYPVDFELMKEKKVPGFTLLTLYGDNQIPSQFKELAYFGVFTSEGHTPDQHEALISPFQLQYGKCSLARWLCQCWSKIQDDEK